ncbi:unnamed protein product [Bursaphelenchus xylophilus]|uniref:(pine wood nematode) hypothetical protein n=1 Tax=Bursaphelenchus xylophilus TaxID=6326 RepID=A0A1I7SX63_BURXY|nr:unnamed protein product [Bursaphelenchus xylophilus]CAG9100200.1 unnamed protein product [Bursaphelenchus xylophilus]
MNLLWVVLAIGGVIAQRAYPELSDEDKVSAEIVTEPVDGNLKGQVIRLKNPLDWLKDVKNVIKEDVNHLFHGSDTSEEEVTRRFGFTRSHEFQHEKGLKNLWPGEKEWDDHPRPTPKNPLSRDVKRHPDFKPIDYTPLEDEKPTENEAPHKKNHPIDPMVHPRPPFDNAPPSEEDTGEFNCVCKPKIVRGRPQSFFTNLDCTCKDSKGENNPLEEKIHEDKKKAEQNGWKRFSDWIKKLKEFKNKEVEALRKWREGKEHRELEREQRENATTPNYHEHDDADTCDNPAHNHPVKTDDKKQKKQKKTKKHDDDSNSSSSSDESAEKKQKKDKKEKKEKKHKKEKKEKRHSSSTRDHESTHVQSTVQPTTFQPTTEETTTLVPTGSTHGPTTTVIERILK